MPISASRIAYNNLVVHKLLSPSSLLPASSIRHNRIGNTLGSCRTSATATAAAQDVNDAGNTKATIQPPNVFDEATSLALSAKRGEPEAWVALVEDFLPRSLRSSDHASGLETTRNVKYLPSLLSKARSTNPLKLDILGYMGIDEGRWDAVSWLSRSLSSISRKEDAMEENETRNGAIPWSIAHPTPYELTSLDDITVIPIHFNIDEVRSRKSFIPLKHVRLGLETNPLRSEWLGQIWAMLGYMVLRAADYPVDDAKGKTIMSYVLKILAHLHHIDAIPHTIYTYSETREGSSVYKPPTLSLMAYRIMTVLSDSAWKAEDEKIRKEALDAGVKNWYKGHEVPEPTIQPRIDSLGLEVWLDLILWCSVEGGYYAEACWVVTEMSRRKGNSTWKVIDWSEIHRPVEPRLNWSAKAELQIVQSHINQIGPGFGIAGPSKVPPMVEMGSRTVSREVILSLIDGLANSLRPPVDIQQQIVACRNLLNKKRSVALETHTMKKAALTILDSGIAQINIYPEIADRIVSLIPNQVGDVDENENTSQWTDHASNEDGSAALLGLLHRALYNHAVKGNVQAALRTFHKMQIITDADRTRLINEFAKNLQRRAQDEEDQLISESIINNIPGVQPQIPVHILSAFLNLVTSAQLYDLGRWLLYSDEVDGPFIPTSLYSGTNIQSALLRFATATQDGQLFARISEKLHAPLPIDVLRTLLHCQITLGKWNAAQEVLRHFQAEPNVNWKSIDIMVVARSILRMENDETSGPQSLADAHILLQQLLNGDYNSRRKPWEAIDYTPHRCLSQIYRMLRTLPGLLSQLKGPPFAHLSRTNATVAICSEAFDVLLEGVVETQGSLRGLQLWLQWCQPISPESSDVSEMKDGKELVVSPTLQTLRVLMRPLVRRGKARSKDEEMLVDWAVRACREFGLTDKEIGNELPGLWRSSQAQKRGEHKSLIG